MATINGQKYVLKYYDGSSWHLVKVWRLDANGNWEECNVGRYDGSSWEEIEGQ